MASLTLIGCGSKSSGGDLAVVNGEAISMDEFHRYLERKPVVQVATPQGAQEAQVAAPLGFQAMRDLINRKVMLQVAKDDGVLPTDADVAKELDFRTKQDPTFVQKLQSQGLDLQDIRGELLVDLAKEKILTKGITETVKDAEDFIKANPDKFMTPEQAKLRIVQVADAAGEKQVDQALAGGTPFAQVATQFSTFPNARQNQGMFPVTNVAQMPQALQELVNKTEEQKATAWQPEGNQFVKIYVEQKIKSKPMTIDDNLKENVRRTLALQKGSQAVDIQTRLLNKLRTSDVKVTPTNLRTLWDNAFKSLKDQDLQTGTSKTGAPGAPGAAPAGTPAPGAPATGAPATGAPAPAGGAAVPAKP